MLTINCCLSKPIKHEAEEHQIASTNVEGVRSGFYIYYTAITKMFFTPVFVSLMVTVIEELF